MVLELVYYLICVFNKLEILIGCWGGDTKVLQS